MLKATLLSIFCLALIYSHAAYAGKKHCKPYREKLDNIQSQQRQGYSLKQGQSLKLREQKARDKWWLCEKGLLKTKKKTKSKAKKKAQQQKLAVKKKLKSTNNATNPLVLAPFSSSKAIVVKQKYQGEQLYQWLNFYQAPKGCSKPKSMSKFTACIEDKHRQQLAFESQ